MTATVIPLRQPERETVDLETMLKAWHHYRATGSEAAREVAFRIADDHRALAQGEKK